MKPLVLYYNHRKGKEKEPHLTEKEEDTTMMKVYAVKVNTVNIEGWRNGHVVKAYTLNKEKANEVAKKVVEELKARADWWMDTARNADWEPDVEVVELGEVVE